LPAPLDHDTRTVTDGTDNTTTKLDWPPAPTGQRGRRTTNDYYAGAKMMGT
jgi:hypothetical protein